MNATAVPRLSMHVYQIKSIVFASATWRIHIASAFTPSRVVDIISSDGLPWGVVSCILRMYGSSRAQQNGSVYLS